MSGHSKWATIKRKKGATDAKRGKLFTKSIHEITVAVKEGKSGDPGMNPRLRFAIDRAKSVNLPADNIDRAIRRALGTEKGEEKHELFYEGYGPGGTAVLVEVLTENKNRTVGEVRHAFSKAGGNLGETNCVGWMFKKLGVILAKKDSLGEDQMMELALEAGADDVQDAGEVWEVTANPSAFNAVRDKLSAKITLDSAELQMVPDNYIQLSKDDSEKVGKLIDALDELDDVMNVFVNCEFSAE